MLTMLINGRGDEGYALSDNEIRDPIISLITAGYETTSAALAWAIYTLLTLPAPGTTPPTKSTACSAADRRPRADLEALTYLNGVVHETLRLYSPGVISARRVMRDLSFDGHRIRAGRLLIFSAVRHPPAPRAVAGTNRIPPSSAGIPAHPTTASPRRTSSSRSAEGCIGASGRSWPLPR